MSETWIAVLAIGSSALIGLMAIFVPLWVRGEAERRRYMDRKIDKENAKLNKRIDDCSRSHVHDELCLERSGNIKHEIEGMKGGKS